MDFGLKEEYFNQFYIKLEINKLKFFIFEHLVN